MGKKEPSIEEYLQSIDTEKVSDALWDPPVAWNRWHGDGKSSTGGIFHLESMLTSKGTYKAKVVKRGTTVVEEEWLEGPPSLEQLVEGLLAKI